jgi:hypothetical protein
MRLKIIVQSILEFDLNTIHQFYQKWHIHHYLHPIRQ